MVIFQGYFHLPKDTLRKSQPANDTISFLQAHIYYL